MASPASREQRAWRRNAICRGAGDRFQRSVRLVNPAYFRGFTWQHKRNHDDPGFRARETIAAIDPLFDTDFVYDKSSPKTNMKKRVLSGIQPTGSPHIGNY